MHESVMDFIKQETESLDLSGAIVLEVGSLNVNGSARELIQPRCKSYTGIDIRPGPGVDIQCGIEGFDPGVGYDLVICTEMLEHVEDWRAAIYGLKDALAPGGLLLLTTRSPGFPRHEHPGDFWRFTISDMFRIFADMVALRVNSDPQVEGVFVSCKAPLLVDLEEIEVGRVE